MDFIKTWEIYEKIDKDFEGMKGKKFQLKSSWMLGGNLITVGEKATVSMSGAGCPGLFVRGSIINNLTGFERWEPIQEPVSFIEAVESGKNFRCEHKDLPLNPRLKYFETEGFIYHLYENCFGRDYKNIILEGKYYTQEDE